MNIYFYFIKVNKHMQVLGSQANAKCFYSNEQYCNAHTQPTQPHRYMHTHKERERERETDTHTTKPLLKALSK